MLLAVGPAQVYFPLLLVGLALPLRVSDDYIIRVAVEAGLYIILALGLNLVVGYCGLLDVGYVAFYAIGAYSYALLASSQFNVHLPFLIVLPIGGALAAVLGILIGFPTLRLRGDYLAIVTLGFGEMIRFLLNNLNGVTNWPQGVSGIDAYSGHAPRSAAPWSAPMPCSSASGWPTSRASRPRSSPTAIRSAWRWQHRLAPTSWSWARLSWAALQPSCAGTTACVALILASDCVGYHS